MAFISTKSPRSLEKIWREEFCESPGMANGPHIYDCSDGNKKDCQYCAELERDSGGVRELTIKMYKEKLAVSSWMDEALENSDEYDQDSQDSFLNSESRSEGNRCVDTPENCIQTSNPSPLPSDGQVPHNFTYETRLGESTPDFSGNFQSENVDVEQAVIQ